MSFQSRQCSGASLAASRNDEDVESWLMVWAAGQGWDLSVPRVGMLSPQACPLPSRATASLCPFLSTWQIWARGVCRLLWPPGHLPVRGLGETEADPLGGAQQQDEGPELDHGKLPLGIKKKLFTVRMVSTGAGCPERLWDLTLWRCSRLHWTRPYTSPSD